MQEHNLAQIEITSNFLFSRLREGRFVRSWNADDGEGISTIARVCEDVEGGVVEEHFVVLLKWLVGRWEWGSGSLWNRYDLARLYICSATQLRINLVVGKVEFMSRNV